MDGHQDDTRSIALPGMPCVRRRAANTQNTFVQRQGEHPTMTIEMIAATNQVIVVGMLDTMLIRDSEAKRDKERGRRAMIEVTKKVGRDREKGGRWQTMALQVRSPYGGMFAM